MLTPPFSSASLLNLSFIHKPMSKLTRWSALALCLGLAACSSDPATFLTYAHQKTETPGTFDATKAPQRTDALALNYANSVESIFRARSTGARYTREGSDTALVGLAAFTGAAESMTINASSLSAMGLASSGLLQLRNIFDAKGRSNAYFEAAERIHSAIKDYGAHNLNDVSETQLTPNGWTLVNVVQSNIDIVSKILNGHLPSPEALAQASEPMSPRGAFPQPTGATPANNIPTNSLVKAPLPAASRPQAFNKNDRVGNTEVVLVDVQEDQRRISAWISGQQLAGNFITLESFVRAAGVKETLKGAAAATRARHLVREATSRTAIDRLLPLIKPGALDDTETQGDPLKPPFPDPSKPAAASPGTPGSGMKPAFPGASQPGGGTSATPGSGNKPAFPDPSKPQ